MQSGGSSGSEGDTQGDATLDAMYREVMAGPEIYRPTGIWWHLIDSMRDLANDHSNFKRKLGKFFSFNPVFSRDHKLFCRILELSADSASRNTLPATCDDPIRVFPSPEAAKVYFEYVIRLNLYVRSRDSHNFVAGVEEPAQGNPLNIFLGGKRISADIPTSYFDLLQMEAAFPFIAQGMHTLLELGGGYGALAYLCHKRFDVRYFLVDIPPSLYVAQEYLARVLPEKRIFRFRPFEAYSQVADELQEVDLAFFTPNQMELLPSRSVDLCINVNSLGDLTDEQVCRYMSLLSDLTRRGIWSRNEVNQGSYLRLVRIYDGKQIPVPSIDCYVAPHMERKIHWDELNPSYSVMTFQPLDGS